MEDGILEIRRDLVLCRLYFWLTYRLRGSTGTCRVDVGTIEPWIGDLFEDSVVTIDQDDGLTNEDKSYVLKLLKECGGFQELFDATCRHEEGILTYRIIQGFRLTSMDYRKDSHGSYIHGVYSGRDSNKESFVSSVRYYLNPEEAYIIYIEDDGGGVRNKVVFKEMAYDALKGYLDAWGYSTQGIVQYLKDLEDYETLDPRKGPKPKKTVWDALFEEEVSSHA